MSEPEASRFRIQINYKTGTSMIIECDRLAVSEVSGDIRSVNWTNASPDPLFLGIKDIESIWQLKDEEPS